MLSNSRMLSWVMHRTELWIWARHNVALGAAIGVSFGLLIPLGQLPASAFLAVILRAHIGAASVATLISNPITFAPLYYAAYKFGENVTGVKFVPLSDSEGWLTSNAGPGNLRIIGIWYNLRHCVLLIWGKL